jgi:hypothetical protein
MSNNNLDDERSNRVFNALLLIVTAAFILGTLIGMHFNK